jgi:hypothetical protein
VILSLADREEVESLFIEYKTGIVCFLESHDISNVEYLGNNKLRFRVHMEYEDGLELGVELMQSMHPDDVTIEWTDVDTAQITLWWDLRDA